MDLLDVIELEGFSVFKLFGNRWDIANISSVIRIQRSRHCEDREHLWLLGLGLQFRNRLLTQKFELTLLESWLPKHFLDHVEDFQQRVSFGFQADIELLLARGNADARIQFIESVIQVLEGFLCGASSEQSTKHIHRGRLSIEGCFVSKSKIETHRYRTPPRLLRKHRKRKPRLELSSHGTRFHVLRTRVELLAVACGFAAGVASNQFVDLGTLGNLNPLGRRYRDKETYGAVIANQVFLSYPLNIRCCCFLKSVPKQKIQTPISLCGPIAQPDRQTLCFRCHHLALVEEFPFRPLYFRIGDRVFREPLERSDHGFPSFFK